jgi:replicative DNA helicase
LVDWASFVNEGGDDSYDWVIDELIERGERVIVVAAEGVGKTMLARQVAILSGCGIHPFTYQKMKQIRTLTIDLENPERIIRRTSTSIMKTALARGYTTSPSAKLLVKPSGLDLLKPEDRMVLERAIEDTNPELLVMGPLYKAFIDPGGRTSEAVAVEVARYFDYIRDVYKCALWLEHHAPLGDSMTNRQLRPFGSAVWSRWPEFGISLTPDLTGGLHVYDVRHFRGARDERPFPTKMRRGKLFPFEVLEYAKVNK